LKAPSRAAALAQVDAPRNRRRARSLAEDDDSDSVLPSNQRKAEHLNERGSTSRTPRRAGRSRSIKA
jgi:hypothetical protein